MSPISFNNRRFRQLAEGALELLSAPATVDPAALQHLAADLARVSPEGGLAVMKLGVSLRWMVQTYLATAPADRAALADGLDAWSRAFLEATVGAPSPPAATVVALPAPEAAEAREPRRDIFG